MTRINVKFFWGAVFTALVILGIFFVVKNYSFFEDNQSEKYNLAKFTDCLAEKDVQIYANYADVNTQMQLNLFGNFSKKLEIIDCGNSSSECLGVIIYPTWKVNGVLIHGGLSLTVLSRFSNCPLE
jgi:hypothetical protein